MFVRKLLLDSWHVLRTVLSKPIRKDLGNLDILKLWTCYSVHYFRISCVSSSSLKYSIHVYLCVHISYYFKISVKMFDYLLFHFKNYALIIILIQKSNSVIPYSMFIINFAAILMQIFVVIIVYEYFFFYSKSHVVMKMIYRHVSQ